MKLSLRRCQQSIRAQTFTEWIKIRSDGLVIFAFSWREGHASGGICVRGEARGEACSFRSGGSLTSSRGSFRDVTNVTVAPLSVDEKPVLYFRTAKE